MKEINVETINGIQRETVYTVGDVVSGAVPLLGLMMSCNDSMKRGNGRSRGKIHYLEIPCAFDIETTNITEDLSQRLDLTDDTVYQYLRGLTLVYDDELKNNIADFDRLRKRLFSQIRIIKGHQNIDTVYQELSELFPYWFRQDAVNPADQLRRIVDVYEQNRPNKGKTDFRPFSYMYHWQFCISQYVIFGRTWKEFSTLLSTLSTRMNLGADHRLVVYVHNLSFEFQFFRYFVRVDDGFFKEERKPVTVYISEGIEFRDSYALSNMSLAKFCENEGGVIHYKLSGDDYDYNKIRTADTELTEKEQAYCFNDVRGLSECIASRMKQNTLAEIPLTSTGYVRRDFRNAVKRNPKNIAIFHNGIYDAEMYNLFRDAFRGGDTHANFNAAGQIVHDVQSFDIASSYPAVMVTEQFPMGAFKKISNEGFKRGFCEKHDMAWIGRFRFYDIHLKKGAVDPYIPFSKCVHVSGHYKTKDGSEDHKNIYDNGRILRAEALEIVITDIDWKIINDSYDYKTARVREVYATGYGYLPDEFRDTVKKYFHDKTALKGIDEKYYEYMRSKNRINSAYGMMVQKIETEEVHYTHGEYETVTLPLQEQIDKYFRNKNNFLLYQWGVWVTAHARARLHEGIKCAGRTAIYWDTDSVKCDGGDHRAAFDKLNERYKQLAIENGAYADDRKGIRHYMGIFEYEETYKRFITLGAKKYLVETQDGKMHSTIAGVSKARGESFFEKFGMEVFKAGTVIPDSGHLVAYYNDDGIHTITVDGCRMVTASNIALVDDTYTLGITGDYADLLRKVLNNETDIIYND